MGMRPKKMEIMMVKVCAFDDSLNKYDRQYVIGITERPNITSSTVAARSGSSMQATSQPLPVNAWMSNAAIKMSIRPNGAMYIRKSHA